MDSRRPLGHGAKMSFALTPISLALSESDQPMLVYWVIGSILLVGNGLQGWVALLQYYQGKKVDTAQFVTRAEFLQAKADRDKQLSDSIESINSQVSAVSKLVAELNKDLPAIHRALGRLEGHDEAEVKTPTRRR
ncbi:MAG: hypothetical protein OJI67_17455 [Prosthecobacter sp.]|nr:hypothetical protein [Prosthecobacter sp.]